jgi:hypothetical protein
MFHSMLIIALGLHNIGTSGLVYVVYFICAMTGGDFDISAARPDSEPSAGQFAVFEVQW